MSTWLRTSVLCDLMWAHSLNCLLSVSRHRPNGHPSDLPSTPEYPNAYSSSSLGCVLSGISHTACPEWARFPGVVPLRPNLPPQPLATTVYLRAQTRKLVLIHDSSLSFSPHSINKYCQLYLQRISQEEKVTSTTTSQASSPPLPSRCMH